MRDQKTIQVQAHGDERTGKRDLRGMCIVTNRAKIGPLAGKPFKDCFNGVIVPEDADIEDEKTWLLPGDSMTVPMELAFHLAGDLWDSKLADRGDMINRYGGFEYEQSDRTAVGRAVPLREIGPPEMPDLVLQKTDARGRPMGQPMAMYELYLRDYARKALKGGAKNAAA